MSVKLVYKFPGLQVPQPHDAVQRARRDVPTFSIPALVSAGRGGGTSLAGMLYLLYFLCLLVSAGRGGASLAGMLYLLYLSIYTRRAPLM